MTKLIVAGCSVSDYTCVDKVWGEYLSDQLTIPYMHEAAACGSNYRIWRKLSSHIINGTITPDDIVFVQYTTLERNEFWSSTIEQNNHLRDSLHNGDIIRFKSHSYSWHSGTEAKIMKLYERFINIDFETEKFINNHMMFQCLAKEYGIKNLYFLKVGNYAIDNMSFIDYYKNNYVYYDRISMPQYHLKNDPGHFSILGHEDLANYVMEKLK